MISSAGVRYIWRADTRICGKGLTAWRGLYSESPAWPPFKTRCFCFAGGSGTGSWDCTGKGQICAGVQASGVRELPVAQEWKRGKGNHSAAVPLAHGRTERGTAESEPAIAWIKAGINCGKSLKTLAFCPVLLYNGIMEKITWIQKMPLQAPSFDSERSLSSQTLEGHCCWVRNNFRCFYYCDAGLFNI